MVFTNGNCVAWLFFSAQSRKLLREENSSMKQKSSGGKKQRKRERFWFLFAFYWITVSSLEPVTRDQCYWLECPLIFFFSLISAKLQAFDPSEKTVSCMMSDKDEKMDKTPLRYRVGFQDQLVTEEPGMISHRSGPKQQQTAHISKINN